MEQQRFFLILALFFIAYLMFDAWQRDFGPEPVAGTVPASTSQPTSSSAASSVPMGSDTKASIPAADTSSVPTSAQVQAATSRQRVVVETDTLHVEIDTHGGDVRRVDLLRYPLELAGAEPFHLLNDGQKNFFIAQSGFTTKRDRGDGTLIGAPNHTTIYNVQANQYKLEDGEDKLDVDLFWTSQDGVRFIKRFQFSRGTHLVKVQHIIENPTDKVWRGNIYQQLQRSPIAKEDQQAFIYTYTGGVIYDPENKYQKIDFSDMEDEKLNKTFSAGWTAMIQHYFLGAWIPDQETKFTYYTSVPASERYVIGMQSANEYQVAAGQQLVLSNKLYVGPKIQDDLEQIAKGLELTVDYGVLTFISKPLFWLLKVIHNLVNNWGWAIVVLTILIKLAFYKLSEASYKSMANMRKVQPRLVALKERYGSDKQKMNQALMELYRKEKINPLGGCLPILIQIPVFIALYWVLLESVELRQAQWILWIKDMSTADPYFILPVIMGVTMFIQHRLNPSPVDPIQAKVMMALPIVFTVFFAFFPAGLVLYWVVNNTLSIAQQWYITRIIIKA